MAKVPKSVCNVQFHNLYHWWTIYMHLSKHEQQVNKVYFTANSLKLIAPKCIFMAFYNVFQQVDKVQHPD